MSRKNRLLVFAISLTTSLFLCVSITNAAEKGLVAYWPLDGDAKDATGNGNDGTITGATEWVEGVEGQALEFSGGMVDCGNDASLSVSPMSCMFWMRPSENLGPDQPRTNLIYYACGPMFAVKLPPANEPEKPAGSIRAWICGPEPAAATAAHSTQTEWAADQWYHLAMTFDEKELVLYVDGEVQARTLAEKPGEIEPRKTTFTMNGNMVFPGAIDEVKLYDLALSQAEVLALSGLAVEARGKLTSVWGSIKRRASDHQ